MDIVAGIESVAMWRDSLSFFARSTSTLLSCSRLRVVVEDDALKSSWDARICISDALIKLW